VGILFKCTLKTSESLVYSEGAGWNIHSNNGSPKQFLTYDTSLNSNKNYFKNPAFSVIQSSASGTLANSLALPTASLGYLGETEWGIAASGGTPAYAFNSANESVTFTGAASTTAIYLLQRLESRDTNRLKAKTVTFSCEISNSLLTSVIWEVFRPTTSNDTHGTIATPTQTLIANGTFTVNSTLSKYSATFALPSEVSRGLEVRLRVGAQTSGTWVVSRLQLEEGSTATDFNCEDYPKELRKCQRYFQTNPLGWVLTTNSISSYMSVSGTLLVEMRTTPIIAQLTTDVYGIATGPNTDSNYSSTNSDIALVVASSNGVARIRLTGLGAVSPTNAFFTLGPENKFSLSAHIP
jgi:hypothetical protein